MEITPQFYAGVIVGIIFTTLTVWICIKYLFRE